jgi:hypothetical protein
MTTRSSRREPVRRLWPVPCWSRPASSHQGLLHGLFFATDPTAFNRLQLRMMEEFLSDTAEVLSRRPVDPLRRALELLMKATAERRP